MSHHNFIHLTERKSGAFLYVNPANVAAIEAKSEGSTDYATVFLTSGQVFDVAETAGAVREKCHH